LKKVCMMVTNPVTNDARVINEATSLTENGYNITVLATRDVYSPKQETLNGFKIKRYYKRFRNNSIPGKIEFTLKFTLAAIKEKADIYHSNDLSTLLECYLAAKICRAKIVYDSHEVNADPLMTGYFDKLYYWLERFLISRVDAVITVNDFIADFLYNRYHLKKCITVIMNCPYLHEQAEASRAIPDLKCLEEIKTEILKGNKIILYQGIIFEERGLKQLVQAMNYLPESYSLFIIGKGALLPELIDIVRKNGLNERVFFPGQLSLAQLAACTLLADVGVTFNEGKLLNHLYSSPNKLFQYIHAGVPVLARDFPFIRQVVLGSDVGIVIDSIEPLKIASTIKEMLQDKERLSNFKINTCKAREMFNWEKESLKLIEVYRKVSEKLGNPLQKPEIL
jgi:glycosyltransferase involved in cell wall biosynthesis